MLNGKRVRLDWSQFAAGRLVSWVFSPDPKTYTSGPFLGMAATCLCLTCILYQMRLERDLFLVRIYFYIFLRSLYGGLCFSV